MEVHVAKAEGKTYYGSRVTKTSISGNRPGHGSWIHRNYSRAEKANAVIFCNYLDDLTAEMRVHGGGKTAFTCAEPQVIIALLLAGATPDSVRVNEIKCAGQDRYPCRAFCRNYLLRERYMKNGVYLYRYKLDLDNELVDVPFR